MIEKDSQHVNRRDLLKTAGGLSVVGLAGCMGNGNGNGNGEGVEDIVIGGAPTGGTLFSASSAIQATVDEHSDSVSITVQETSGPASSIRLYDDNQQIDVVGGTQMGYVDAYESAGQFSDDGVSVLPPQAFPWGKVQMYFMAVEGSGITSTDDLDEDTNFFPSQAGTDTYGASQNIMQHLGLWDTVNILNIQNSDFQGAVSEGRVDAFIGYTVSEAVLAGHLAEADAAHDVYAIETSPDLKEAIDQELALSVEEIQPGGWEQDILSEQDLDSVVSWANGLLFWFGMSVSEEAGHEVARVVQQNSDQIRDSFGVFPDMSDPENMLTGFLSDFPVHPGFASYYQEEDVWSDEYEVASEDVQVP